jgi:hypothetical protein
MIYLVAAYTVAVLILGGYLVWSLRTLHDLSKAAPRDSR